MSSNDQIPNAVIAVVADVLGNHLYSHTKIRVLFAGSGAPGDPPGGNCIDECDSWLKRCNNDPETDAFDVLGRVLENYMEVDTYREEGQEEHPGRLRITETLTRYGLSYSQGGKVLDAGVVPGSSSQTTAFEAGSVAHVVLLLHGIRTRAAWQEMVVEVLHRDGELEVHPIRYGYLDVFRFLLPGPTRSKPIERIARELRNAGAGRARRVSVIAHSFGSYAVAQALAENTDIELYRLVLCGSIVSTSFRWDKVKPRVKEVVNDCGTRDVWPVLASVVTWGYGASGTFGFGTVGVRDRFHPHSHSEYFTRPFVEKYWVPFIRYGRISDSTRPPSPWWISALSLLKLRWLVAALAVALPVLSGIWFWKSLPVEPSPIPVTVVKDGALNPTDIKTLHELFLSDFDKTHMLSDYHLTKNDKVAYTIQYIIWGDFDSMTMFFSIFLPKSDYTFEACKFLIPRYREILNGNIRSLMKGMINQAPGSKAESWDELSFSGRIYLYHETHLLPDRIETLMNEYKKEGLSPQFRSREYLLMRNSPLYEQVIKKGSSGFRVGLRRS